MLREKLARRAAKAGLSLPKPVLAGLEAYFELLRKWNRKISLTALPVELAGDEAVDRLLIEPILAAKYLPSPEASIIDVGSGGGSPAIPMKLAVPGLSLRMIESKTRKAAFLREAVRSLKLDRTTLEAVRFEELLVRPDLHDAADAVTVRAVRIAPKTLAGLQTFVKPGGYVLLFRSAGHGEDTISPPYLSHSASHVLLSQWGSQLRILRKTPIVPRETMENRGK